MTERNDNRFAESALVAFVIYTDENALTLPEARDLAYLVFDSMIAHVETIALRDGHKRSEAS